MVEMTTHLRFLKNSNLTMTNIDFFNLDYDSELFTRSLKNYIEDLPSNTLPLNQRTTQGGIVDDSNISASILSVSNTDDFIQAKTGVFFTEIVGGCSCGDDPVSLNVYCEIIVFFNKHTGELQFSVFDG